MSVTNRIRVGVVGAGYVSRHHLRALRSLDFVDVVGLADLNQKQAADLAREFQVPNVYSSLREMAAARPQVIHILTPPATHCPLTLEALEMGCHVFVEKPMAETAADCDRMIEAAKARGLTLSVNHSARLDPVVLDALEKVRAGAIGDVLAVDFFRSSDYPPYLGGPLPPAYSKGSYPFQDLGVHALYLLEAFLGPLAKVETHYYNSGRDINLIFDEWRVRAETPGGTGHIYLSWNARPMQNVLWIHGTKGVIKADCFLQHCSVYKTFPGPKPAGVILNAINGSLSTIWTAIANVLRFVTGKLKPSPGIFTGVVTFHQALRNSTLPPVPAEEGRRAVAWTEEVSLRADAEHKERTRIPAPPAADVLVTGAGGFLGRPLVRRLVEQGKTVRVLVRRPTRAFDEWQGRVHAIHGDLGNPDTVLRAVEGVSVVYHVGAAMSGGAADFQRGTVAGTQNVIEASLKHGARMVYVSSLSVLDHAGHNRSQKVTEESAYEPFPELRGAYTQTKLEAEKLVLDAARRRGLKAVVLRPGQIFGPGTDKITPSGVIGLAGRWVVVGSDKFRLPLVYVDDVVDALIQAGSQEKPAGEIVQLVDPQPVSLREYLAAARSREPKVVRVPKPVMYLMAIMVETLGKLLKRGVPLTRYRLRSLRPLEGFDQSRAERVLNWRPGVGAQEGLKRTFTAAP